MRWTRRHLYPTYWEHRESELLTLLDHLLHGLAANKGSVTT